MSGFSSEQKAFLSAKLLETHVKQRKQAGTQLSYIEAWHAIAEANRIFGFDGWSRELIRLEQAMKPTIITGAKDRFGKPKPDQVGVAYSATVRITVKAGGLIIIRDGTGFGLAQQASAAGAMEMAIKTAESDAMKRALMTFGNPFGLALYDKDQAGVTDDPEEAGLPPEARPRDPESVIEEVEEALRECRSAEEVGKFRKGRFKELRGELEAEADRDFVDRKIDKRERAFE